MKQVVILTPVDGASGFALTGIRQMSLKRADLWPALQQVCADSGVGVAAVDARLLQEGDESRLRGLADRWGGVLVTLPAPAGSALPGEDELQRLVRRALGYHVKLEVD